jgi:hypothetical protein
MFAFDEALGRRIVEVLSQDGFVEEASRLEQAIREMLSIDPCSRTRAAALVRSMCDSKWLGDLFIKSVECSEWINMLSKFRRSLRDV